MEFIHVIIGVIYDRWRWVIAAAANWRFLIPIYNGSLICYPIHANILLFQILSDLAFLCNRFGPSSHDDAIFSNFCAAIARIRFIWISYEFLLSYRAKLPLKRPWSICSTRIRILSRYNFMFISKRNFSLTLAIGPIRYTRILFDVSLNLRGIWTLLCSRIHCCARPWIS